MSPLQRRTFEERTSRALAAWLADSNLGMRVESANLIGSIEGPRGRILLLKLRFQDRAARRTGFTFPFDDSVSSEQNLSTAQTMLLRLASRMPVLHLPNVPVAAQPVRQ